MKTIKDLLLKYYLPGPFQIMMNQILKSDFEKSLNDPVLHLIYYFLRKEGSDFHPDSVVDMFGKMGISTEDELFQYYEYMDSHGINYIVNRIDPILDIDINSLNTVSYTDLFYRLLNITNGKIEPFMLDRTYYLLDTVSIIELTQKIEVGKLTYIADSRDCDDFYILFKAMLSEKGLGNLAVGNVMAKGHLSGEAEEDSYSHSFILFALNVDILYYDPKTKLVGSLNDIMFQNPNCTMAEIKWMII